MSQVDDLTQLTALDRLLHRMAFGGTALQRDLADIEDALCAHDLHPIAIDRPVFITAVPRAGTTILLECLAGLPEFCSHTYRHMPFLLCPVLWAEIARPFYTHKSARERAHGDGMVITHDSPEAFEEVIWKAFWPEKYHDGIIELWDESDRHSAFEGFLEKHIRKLLLLDRRNGKRGSRYVSKNNANIARLALLPKIFADAVILVPFRNPRDHARSLLKQHRNFGQRQAADPFVRDYMRAVGHLEFGELLHRIALEPSWEPTTPPDTIDYWLRYWTQTYRSLLERYPQARFVDYDRMCAMPEEAAVILHREIGGNALADMCSALARLRAPTLPEGRSDGNELDAAMAIHDALRNAAVNPG